jgi:prophage tail gpP-like protein
VKIKINGNYWINFNDFSLNEQLDTCAATFAFSAKYDPDSQDANYQAIFRPLGFQTVEFFDDNDNLTFTGLILNHDFASGAVNKLVILSGYSLGGVLEDCTIPLAAYPLESAGRSLKEITTRILKYFGLQLVIDKSVTNECSQVFAKSVAKPDGTIKDYLCKLAAQKNVVLAHGVHGEIIYFRPDINARAIGRYTKENVLTMGFRINGQGMHSDITTMRQASRSSEIDADSPAGRGSSDSVKNNLVKQFRPVVDKLSSGSGKDTLRGAKNTLANELRNIKLGFTINRWDNIRIGDVLEVVNDEVRLRTPTRFIVENTVKDAKSEERTMSVTCVLPESFTGGQPKDIFAL